MIMKYAWNIKNGGDIVIKRGNLDKIWIRVILKCINKGVLGHQF